MNAWRDKEHMASGATADEKCENPGLSWIYELSKVRLIEELRNRGVEVDESEKVDDLRKKLKKEVKKPTTGGSEQTQGPEIGEQKSVTVKTGNKMAEDKVRLEFQLGKDDWETYVERLELYFVAHDVENTKQAAVLLTKVSADTYTLIRDLCAPAKPKDKTYAELVQLVGTQLNPKTSEPMERCMFHQSKQKSDESVAEYAARLKRRALKCNFSAAELQNALRDQLTCGLRDHDTRVGLFCEKNLTYDKAYEYATARELALRNANNVEKKTLDNSSQREINMLRDNKKSERDKQTRNPKLGAKTKFGAKQGARSPTRGREGGEAAGIQHTACYRCGGKNHWARNCKHRNKTCDNCGKKGHVKKACRSQGERQGEGTSNGRAKSRETLKYLDNGDQQGAGDTAEEREGSDQDFFLLRTSRERNRIHRVQVGSESDLMYATVKIERKTIEMEIDTGTFVTVIDEATKIKYFPQYQLQPTSLTLKSYGGKKLYPRGIMADVEVEWNDKLRKLNIVVLEEKGPPLIGREWLKAFGLWPLQLFENERKNKKTIFKITEEQLKTELLREFPKLVEKTVGQFNKGTLKLRLKDEAKPVALKARHLPFALREKVEQEIDRLLGLSHIEQVGASEWATPIVPVIKADGSVRICGNFKLTLNPCLVIDKYPLPLIDEIFAGLQGGETFSQIDLSHAYMQILVDEKSREYLTIVTHKGLFQYRKLPEGVASGPGDFQRKMENCLRGVPNASVYLDNIYCTGHDHKEHLETLKKVFTRLEDCNLRVNVAKCDFFKEKLEMLGFVIDKNGLHKSESKIKAIVQAPEPQNAKQLSSFLGLVTYYARFLPNRAEKIKALYDCEKNAKFEWTNKCKGAFEWIKKEIASETVLAHYDPKEKLVLACDASAYGMSAILSHEYKDGTERPIAFASKVIPAKELNRAIIDKEAGAIIFGFKKFYNYVFGRQVTLKTDHKPLIYIFGPKKEIPLTIASRLQRWAYYLSGFTYDISYVRSEANSNCDALSRLPIEDETTVFKTEVNAVRYIEEGITNLTYETVKKQTENCGTLKKVMKWIREGWPSSSTAMTEEELKFHAKREELYVEKECVMKGNRIVIPESMRKQIMKELHRSHLGIVKMKSMARSYVWWPGVDGDVENTARACEVCAILGKKPAKTVLTPWPWPDQAWSRVHTDFLGPLFGKMYMVIIDAYTKWPEVIDMGNNTTAQKVISEFKKLFVRFGLPKHLVTDGGPQYASIDFQEFLRSNGVRHSFSPPYHPATNGAAENFVGTFKDKVTKIVKGGKTVEYAINLFLFDYRTIEHSTTGRSPAWMLYKREMRTRFDLLKPNVRDTVEKKQLLQVKQRSARRTIEFQVGEEVFVDDHKKGNRSRIKARIKKRLTPVTYEVEISPALSWKRHVDQMVKILPNVESDIASGRIEKEEERDIKLRRSERIENKKKVTI